MVSEVAVRDEAGEGGEGWSGKRFAIFRGESAYG